MQTGDLPPTSTRLPDGSLSYSFHINQRSENLSILLEESTDLSNWVDSSIQPSSIEHLPTGFALVSYQISAPLIADRHFLRLKLSSN